MKKLALVAAVMIVLSTFSPLTAAAKPAYCDVALQGCYNDCAGLYSTDFYRSFCYAGCLIGYAGCGA